MIRETVIILCQTTEIQCITSQIYVCRHRCKQGVIGAYCMTFHKNFASSVAVMSTIMTNRTSCSPSHNRVSKRGCVHHSISKDLLGKNTQIRSRTLEPQLPVWQHLEGGVCLTAEHIMCILHLDQTTSRVQTVPNC